jgi:hypothetical protein
MQTYKYWYGGIFHSHYVDKVQEGKNPMSELPPPSPRMKEDYKKKKSERTRIDMYQRRRLYR